MKSILLFILLSIFINAEISVKQIEHMVEKIHMKREGIKLTTLNSTKEPFIRLKKVNNVTVYVVPVKKKFKGVKLHLDALINGKAYVNKKWLKIDDTIMGYKLKYIGKRGVVLRHKNDIRKLFLYKKRDNYIKIEKR